MPCAERSAPNNDDLAPQQKKFKNANIVSAMLCLSLGSSVRLLYNFPYCEGSYDDSVRFPSTDFKHPTNPAPITCYIP
ncbi:hypothetical protein EON64_16825 [archaeon]|nr:MAG: hypothetical protein EON64_16825 [archaeon]